VCKSNDIADFSVTTFWRDDNGILTDCGHIDVEETRGRGLTADQAREALRAIDKAYKSGEPFSPATQTDRSLLRWLMRTYGLSNNAAKAQIENWACPAGTDSESLIERVDFINEHRNKKLAYKVKKIP
jgi:hypothetical protein